MRSAEFAKYDFGDFAPDMQRRHFQDALLQFKRLVGVEAKDVLAFRETWSDEDTEVLRAVDGLAHGFVPGGNLSTKDFANRLPSLKDFNALIQQQSVAIVGSGSSLAHLRKGHVIDGHAEVARFNDLVGSKLTDDTGFKTTMHVMNKGISPVRLGTKGLAHFDMEWMHPWSTYCSRMHSMGHFVNKTRNVGGKLFLIRPTAYCALGDRLMDFTRGFLFYWFVGRLFNDVDMYGFSGKHHYNWVGGGPVGEPFLKFEHLLYRIVKEMDTGMTLV